MIRTNMMWIGTLAILWVACAPKGKDMKFILDKNTSDIVSFRIQFSTGSKDDPTGKQGLNALTAMMISEGGSTVLTYEEVRKALYPMAATISVIADKEATTFVGQCHRDSLDRFYDILTSLILSPRFDETDFKRNREITISYLKNTLRHNDDENLGKWTLQTELYKNHPYGHVDEGTVQSLDSMTLDDVKAFYKARYGRQGLMLGMAGNYPESLVKRLETDFGKLPDLGGEKKPLPAPESIEDLEITIVQKEAIATAISMGYPIAINRSHPDFYALFLANSYFGEHRTFNGVLQDRLREKRGMNYGNYSYIENFVQDGRTTFVLPNIPRQQQYFSIWIRPVTHQNALFAVRCALYELNKVVEKGLTQEQFELARQFIINYSKLFIQTQNRRLGYLMDSEWYGTEMFQKRLEKELMALNANQVNSVIKKYWQSKNLKVVIVTKDAEAVKRGLLEGAATPINYPAAKPAQDILDEDKIVEGYPLNINKVKIKIVKAEELF